MHLLTYEKEECQWFDPSSCGTDSEDFSADTDRHSFSSASEFHVHTFCLVLPITRFKEYFHWELVLIYDSN